MQENKLPRDPDIDIHLLTPYLQGDTTITSRKHPQGEGFLHLVAVPALAYSFLVKA